MSQCKMHANMESQINWIVFVIKDAVSWQLVLNVIWKYFEWQIIDINKMSDGGSGCESGGIRTHFSCTLNKKHTK